VVGEDAEPIRVLVVVGCRLVSNRARASAQHQWMSPALNSSRHSPGRMVKSGGGRLEAGPVSNASVENDPL
jgi:hypothetical protein